MYKIKASNQRFLMSKREPARAIPNIKTLQTDQQAQTAIAEFLISLRVIMRLCFYLIKNNESRGVTITHAKAKLFEILINNIGKIPLCLKSGWTKAEIKREMTRFLEKLDLGDSQSCEWAQRYLTHFFNINYSIWKPFIYLDVYSTATLTTPNLHDYTRGSIPSFGDFKAVLESDSLEREAMCYNNRLEKVVWDGKINFLSLFVFVCFAYWVSHLLKDSIPATVVQFISLSIGILSMKFVVRGFSYVLLSPFSFSSASHLIQKSLLDEISAVDQPLIREEKFRPRKFNTSFSQPVTSVTTPMPIPYVESSSKPPVVDETKFKEKQKTRAPVADLSRITFWPETVVLEWGTSREGMTFPPLRGLIVHNKSKNKETAEIEFFINSTMTRGRSSYPGLHAACRNDFFMRIDEKKYVNCPAKVMTEFNIRIANGAIVPATAHSGIVYNSVTDLTFPEAKYKVKSLSKFADRADLWRVGLFKTCDKFSLSWEHPSENPLPKHLTQANYALYVPGAPKQTHG